MPIPSPVLEAISLELRELEAAAARMRKLHERELLELYPQIAAVREALRALTEELEHRAEIPPGNGEGGRAARPPRPKRSLRTAGGLTPCSGVTPQVPAPAFALPTLMHLRRARKLVACGLARP
jgi:hypothetical protein